MRIPIFALALTLAACADSSGPASGSAQEQAVASASKPDNAAKPVAVSLPHLAYAYSLAYLVPGDRVAAAQDDHRAACEAMGSGRCQLLALERGSGAEKSGSASLKLRVANSEARSFQDALGKSVSDAGGRALDTRVAAEDVSKALVDPRRGSSSANCWLRDSSICCGPAMARSPSWSRRSAASPLHRRSWNKHAAGWPSFAARWPCPNSIYATMPLRLVPRHRGWPDSLAKLRQGLAQTS
nr:protein of unknown function DUF4349 [uncultured organism]